MELIDLHSMEQDLVPDPISWNPKMAFEMAMGDTPEAIQQRYALDYEDFMRILRHPAFRMEVSAHIKDVHKNGVTFRAKARVQAEQYLEVVDQIVNNVELNPNTRLDAIKSVVKWGELEPAASTGSAGNNQPQFNIQINL